MLLVTTGIVLVLCQATDGSAPADTPDGLRAVLCRHRRRRGQPAGVLARVPLPHQRSGDGGGARLLPVRLVQEREHLRHPRPVPREQLRLPPGVQRQEAVIFRRKLPASANYRQVVPDSPWGKMTPLVRTAKMRVLSTPDEIVSAIEAAVPIISQTELRDEESGRTAIIECPIKTMNMNSSQRIYQVDTGPVILPDLTLPPDQWSAGLRLAFIAFNEPTWADFIVDEPTQVAEGVQVHHFSRRLHFTTKNVLLALDDGSLPWEVKTRTTEVIKQGEVTKVRLLPPGVSNPRNSEGDFIQLKDGRILLVYTHFTGGGGDDDAAFLAGRFSSDGGVTWTPDDVTIVPNEGQWNVMSVSLLRLQSGEIATVLPAQAGRGRLPGVSADLDGRGADLERADAVHPAGRLLRGEQRPSHSARERAAGDPRCAARARGRDPVPARRGDVLRLR